MPSSCWRRAVGTLGGAGGLGRARDASPAHPMPELSGIQPAQSLWFQMITSAFSLRGAESVAQRSGSDGLHTEGRRFKSCIAHQRFLFPVCVRRLILLVYQRRASASSSPCGYSSDSLSWPVASLVLSSPQLRPGVSGRPRRRPTRLLPEEERHVTQWSKPGGIVRAAGRSIVDAQRGEHDE